MPHFSTLLPAIDILDSLAAFGINELSTLEIERVKHGSAVSTPVEVYTNNDIVLENAGLIPQGSVIATTGSLHISGQTKSTFALYYAREGISVHDSDSLGGQFFSQSHITFESNAYARFPSFAWVSGDPAISQIRVDSTSRFDGTIAFSSLGEVGLPRLGNISIRGRARGLVLSDGSMNISGALSGSAVTRSFYFYESPSSYVNWLRDATINVSDRPANFSTGVLSNSLLAPVHLTTECIRI